MTSPSEIRVPLWRDDRFWKIVFQIVVAALVFGLLALFIGNLNENMRRQGLQFSFNFLRNSASFSIGESLIPYSPSNTYIRAFLVGILNTLRVILVGFVLTTLLGVLAGVASFSDNWLLRKLSVVYVEIVRNTPLLLQLIFWYFPVFLSLPDARNRLVLPGPIFASKNGIYLPWPAQGPLFWVWLATLVGLAIAAWLVVQQRTRAMVERAASGRPQQRILIGIGVAALLVLVVAMNWQGPQAGEAANQITGGLRLSLEYLAILVGLVVYTGAFIAEIVRSGIQSVSKGQWEAARSLGLKSGQSMQLVVLPQALRVIIPPLNSQYMNLAKNSSLGLAIGYPDIFSVSQTSLNQTGRPLEVFMLMGSIYLLANLVISLIMNTLNRSVQFKER
ncbi:MAG: ABC transporter permease subunit [Cyanobacteria bacterium Co-bin13]|nr:ABC transporter permease subunit [Cyanobacteria bacterium Co-bin13]